MAAAYTSIYLHKVTVHVLSYTQPVTSLPIPSPPLTHLANLPLCSASSWQCCGNDRETTERGGESQPSTQRYIPPSGFSLSFSLLSGPQWSGGCPSSRPSCGGQSVHGVLHIQQRCHSSLRCHGHIQPISVLSHDLALKWSIMTFELYSVLIVDWDVHHGNATQNQFYNDKRYNPYCSQTCCAVLLMS